MDALLVPLYDGMGNLDILVNGNPVFSSLQMNRFPEDGEIVEILRQFADKPGE